MEPLTGDDQQPATVDEMLCKNCQFQKFEPGHPINLCADCRKTLINYPIPKWILLFALGLLVVIVVSLVRTQYYISAAVHLGKAENAIANRHFVIAQRELSDVLKKFPSDLTTNANMIIASSYNFDLAAAGLAYENIKDKKIEDQDFYTMIINAMNFIESSFGQDSIISKKTSAFKNDPVKLLEMYYQADSLPLANKVEIANYLYDLKDYGAAERIVVDVLNSDRNYYQAISLMSAIKRQTGKYDEALILCDDLLEINRDDIYAMSQKARVELKRGRDTQAAAYAKEAWALDSTNTSSLEAMAMVDFFAGRKKESRSKLLQIKAAEAAMGVNYITNRLSAIINGSEIYR